jgi:hypothetical protein
MNYSVDDYSMGHILRFARETGLDTLTIDFVTGEGQPAGLLREPISQLPHWYTKMFWESIRNSGSDRSLVQSAMLTLKYDLQRTRLSPNATNGLQSPYICDVTVLDTRGKSYFAHFEDGGMSRDFCRPHLSVGGGIRPVGFDADKSKTGFLVTRS